MTNRTWLITGISSGLGKALAQSVLEIGDIVIGTFRKHEQVEAFNKQQIKNAKAVLLDITDVKNIETCIQKIITEYGKIDVLVVLPFMRKEKHGHIVQISSHGGIKAFAGFGIYNASKFALEGFSEAMAQEVAPLGIKVTLVEPGPFRTKFASNSLGQAHNIIEDYLKTAGVFRSKLKSVDGKQEGDPLKAAAAIISAVNSKKGTLRLPLGKTSLLTIGAKLESLKSDLEINRETAQNAVF